MGVVFFNVDQHQCWRAGDCTTGSLSGPDDYSVNGSTLSITYSEQGFLSVTKRSAMRKKRLQQLPPP
jgi:hypothetical protein